MSHTDETPRAVPLPVPSAPVAAVAPLARRAAEGPTGAEVAGALFDGRWILLGCVAVALALAAAYLVIATPRWRAEALLRIEEREPTPMMDPITTGLGAASVKAEIEMLRARTLVSAAVERLGLDVTAEPRRMPIVGAAWARFAPRSGLARPPLGLGARFGWGGEKIAIERLDVPEQLLGVPLVLTADGEGGFTLADPDGFLLADGAVGTPVEGKDGAGRPVRVVVKELAARPGTEFLVSRSRIPEVASELERHLAVEERGKDTGVVALKLEGTDRAGVTATLDAVLETYLRQNVMRTSARASQMVVLLDARLPVLKSNSEQAERALEAWKLKNATVDFGAEAKASLERSVVIEHKIADLESKREELSRRYTDRHPGIGELSDEIDALRLQQKIIDAKLRTLPSAELNAVRLARDVAAASAIYATMLERAQQYRIAAKSPGSASVVDAPAVPTEPFAPKALPVLALALALGLVAGIVASILRSRMGGAGDPLEVEVATGLPVLGTVPHSSTESSIARTIHRRLTGRRAAALHAVNPGDVAVEDLRTLRTNLATALRAAKTNVVAISGPAPGVGKSFVCLNLGLLLASARRKVLLVDADLRRGRLHREFGLKRTPGLAEVLAGKSTFDAAIQQSATQGLDLLSAGELPEDPTALLETPGFQELLADAGRRYDVVLVDTAAILAVTDPSLVARHAGLSLLVLRAGEHPVEEVALAVKRLRQSGAHVDGAILNDLRPGRHTRYRYEYRSGARAGS